ncbi:MAG: CsbD family protein [Bdellovibrio sp.]|nr:CsbD family protein [Bdellovibrio sp.]
MNKDIVQGKWKEIKGDLRKAWGNITEDELEKTKGNVTAIAGVLQQKYGFAKEEATEMVSRVVEKYSSAARDSLRDRGDNPSPRNHL